MALYSQIPLRPGDDADFAVQLNENVSPWWKAGETVRLQRRADLRDGDIGLFRSREGMVFRQFCADSQGNIYLFSPDRRSDLVVPAGGGMPVCYGRVILSRPIPLPMD